MVIVGGALAAAIAGAAVGAHARPAASFAGATLGPRMDFDRAAHPWAPPETSPIQIAAKIAAARDG